MRVHVTRRWTNHRLQPCARIDKCTGTTQAAGLRRERRACRTVRPGNRAPDLPAHRDRDRAAVRTQIATRFSGQGGHRQWGVSDPTRGPRGEGSGSGTGIAHAPSPSTHLSSVHHTGGRRRRPISTLTATQVASGPEVACPTEALTNGGELL